MAYTGNLRNSVVMTLSCDTIGVAVLADVTVNAVLVDGSEGRVEVLVSPSDAADVCAVEVDVDRSDVTASVPSYEVDSSRSSSTVVLTVCVSRVTGSDSVDCTSESLDVGVE